MESKPFALYRRRSSESPAALIGSFSTSKEAHDEAVALENACERDWIVIKSLAGLIVSQYGRAR